MLRDGSTLRLRPVRPDDGGRLQDLHERLSRESLYFRFFSVPAGHAPEVARLLRADYDNEFVLVAESGGRLSAVASYTRDPATPGRAQVAFTIADALQGRGIGTRMLETLAGIARDHHIRTFDAYVLYDNDRMLNVFLDSGFEVTQRLDGGMFHVALSLEGVALMPLFLSCRAAARARTSATAARA